MNPYSPPGVAAAPYPPSPQAYGVASGVSDVAIELLRQTRPWVMLLSVLCFIGSVFMLLAAVGLALMGAAASSFGGAAPPFSSALGLVYVPFAGLYVYPGLKLWSYAGAIARLVGSRSPADLESALGQQKSFWKYSGIMSITVIALYLVAIVAAVGIGVFSAMKK